MVPTTEPVIEAPKPEPAPARIEIPRAAPPPVPPAAPGPIPPTSVWLNTFPRNPAQQPRPQTRIIHHTVPSPAPLQAPSVPARISVPRSPERNAAILVASALLLPAVYMMSAHSPAPETIATAALPPPVMPLQRPTSPPRAVAPAPLPKPVPPSTNEWTMPAVPLPQYVRNWNTDTIAVTSSVTPPKPQTVHEDVGARELQTKMKTFGIYAGPITGAFDAPTLKAMRTAAAIISNNPDPITAAPDAGDARIIIDALQQQADSMLYAVDQFPFAGRAPSWVLAVFDDAVLKSVADQVGRALNTGSTGAHSIDGGRSGITIVAMIRPDPSSGGTLACRAYHLTFSKAGMHFAVTARACRNPFGNDWTVARR